MQTIIRSNIDEKKNNSLICILIIIIIYSILEMFLKTKFKY
jgi:hypothetical protein